VAKKLKNVKFYLFVNSYSGKKIATYIKLRFHGKRLIKVIKKLSIVFNFRYIPIYNFIVFDLKPACPYQRLPMSLKIYLEVEKELSKLSEEKLDGYSTALKDYQRQLLYPAIERAVGNLLENINDDSEFDELLEEKFKSSIHIYYKVARKYGLPTMRNIPFILSIIF